MTELDPILSSFGLSPADHSVTPITHGFINRTYRITGEKSYVLQRINKQVFRQPEVIARNLRMASDHLSKYHPEYLFPGCIPTASGAEMAWDDAGYPWRLFPYIPDTYTINQVDRVAQAYSAASGFGLLSRNLDGIDVSRFQETIPRFHDLGLRYDQFRQALAGAKSDRLEQSAEAIRIAEQFSPLVDEYNTLIRKGTLVLRVFHNDTKINNILFNSSTQAAVCVIDLDTLMPGYFIYDLGDMIRTFVSPVDEEEKDLSRVAVRKEIYDATVSGYLSQMDAVLSPDEKLAIPFAGKMMTYIMALRALTDHLNGDVYYQIKYPGHNLVRARNQFQLLQLLP